MTEPTAAAQTAPLAPPEPVQTLTLTPPAPPQPVATTAAPKMAPAVPEAALPGLDAKVEDYVTSLLTSDARSPDFVKKSNDVRTMGDKEIREAANTSNRLLQVPVKELNAGGLSKGAKVGTTLTELRRTVEELDPKEATRAKKLLGMIPFGNKLRDYFQRYESAQDHLNAIIQALYDGRDELLRDNAALNQEKQNLWTTMERLNQYIYVAERLDAKLSTRIAEIETTDPERAKALKEDVLFYVRQKHQDLLTQLAVSIQGYLAMDIIIKNNLELIKGVDRATTTTVSALRTAVTVALALNNQQLVLNQISALNTTTSNMIESTSEMLRDNSARIQQQAAESTVGLQQLQNAFANIYATMDTIDKFKVQALDTMAATIGVLQNETTKAQDYIDRANQRGTDDMGINALDIDAPGRV